MKSDNRWLLLVVIAILIASVAIAAMITTGGGVASLGKYGDSSTYLNNVKLEEGDYITLTPSDAHNSLIITGTAGGDGDNGNITMVGDADTSTVFTVEGEGNQLWFEGSTADIWEIILTAADPSGADYTVTLPAVTGIVLLSEQIDTESELESQLTDVTDVFTNTDGALSDDDVTLADVQSATTSDFHNIGGADDDVPESGDFGAAADLDAGGSVSASAIGSSEISDGSVAEADLDIDNAAVDEYVLTYETDSGKLHWQAEGGGVGQLSDLSDVGTVNYTSGNVLVADGVNYDSAQLAHSQLNNDEASIHLGVDTVKDTHIDWGTGASQVSASDVPDEDVGDITITTGVWAVEDNSHAHTTTSISGLDVSEDLNLIGGTGITLTGDTLSCDLGTSIDASEIETGAVADDEIDYSAVTLTDFDYQTAWRVFYSDSLGDVTELVLGSDGQYLKSTGASSAPAWDTPGGSGDITAVGDVASDAAFTSDGTAGTSLWFYDAQGRGQLTIADLSEVRTYTLPNATGEISLLGQEIDVSDETNLVAGTNISLSDDTLNVADAWWDALGDISLTSSYVIVGSSGNVAAAVDMTGDVGISNTGVTTIGSDKITEAMLKEVGAAAADEDILTYETTTGDFEWHTPAELITAGTNLAWTGTTLDATDTQLTQEEVDDLIAALINDAESVHTRITITYDDTDDAYDFVVDDMADDMGDVDTEAELESTLTNVTDVYTNLDGDPIYETELDLASELETQLTDTTNVFTEDDTDMITAAMLADEDWGDVSVATNVVTIDDDVIDVDNFADDDWGDISVATNVISLDADTVADNEIDYSAVTLDDFDYQTAWRLFYSNTDGDVTEIAFGTDGQYLKSQGTTSVLTWETPSGTGDITAVGDVASDDAFTADSSGATLWFEGTTADTYEVILTSADPSGSDFTATLQAATGYVVVDNNACTDIEGSHLSIATGTLNVDDDFLLDTGDVGTGVYDFGGATSLEIPNGTNPTTSVEGQIAYDTDDEAIEVYDGAASRLIGTVHTFSGSIYDPDSIQSTSDAVPILAVESDWAPHGIKLISVGIKTQGNTTYSIDFEEWTAPNDGSPSAIETVATSASYEAEDDGTLTDSDIAVGSIIYVDLPATDIDMLQVWGTYYIKDGD